MIGDTNGGGATDTLTITIGGAGGTLTGAGTRPHRRENQPVQVLGDRRRCAGQRPWRTVSTTAAAVADHDTALRTDPIDREFADMRDRLLAAQPAPRQTLPSAPSDSLSGVDDKTLRRQVFDLFQAKKNIEGLRLASGRWRTPAGRHRHSMARGGHLHMSETIVTGQAKIAATGIVQRLLSPDPAHVLMAGVTLYWAPTNAAPIFVGSSASVTSVHDGTGSGVPLGSSSPAVASSLRFDADNAGNIWITGTAGDIVYFIGN